jgi:hypothetical protein
MDLPGDLIVELGHAFTEPSSNPQNIISFPILKTNIAQKLGSILLPVKYNVCEESITIA